MIVRESFKIRTTAIRVQRKLIAIRSLAALAIASGNNACCEEPTVRRNDTAKSHPKCRIPHDDNSCDSVVREIYNGEGRRWGQRRYTVPGASDGSAATKAER
ncbi:hypothetical protein KM043_006037 [Ampulex compressa]|nr:hypothetical protein KM043_006037 [Ampulex compressa]